MAAKKRTKKAPATAKKSGSRKLVSVATERKPSTPGEKTERMNFRLTPDQREAWQDAAESQGLTMTAWIVRLATLEINKNNK